MFSKAFVVATEELGGFHGEAEVPLMLYPRMVACNPSL